jgi:hypothetical protein
MVCVFDSRGNYIVCEKKETISIVCLPSLAAKLRYNNNFPKSFPRQKASIFCRPSFFRTAPVMRTKKLGDFCEKAVEKKEKRPTFFSIRRTFL